ncbi:MAG: hypothetical protein ACKV2T_20255 [Kofleriaceae bacterium]
MGDDVAEKTADPPRRRWTLIALEIVAAFGAMAVMLRWSTGIWVVALERPAQVSGLASLQLRLMAIAIPLIVALVVTARIKQGRHFEVTSRIACAAFSGLVTGFVAGGLVLALKNTPWPLNADNGDSGQIAAWANGYHFEWVNDYPPSFYPPLYPWLLSKYMVLTDQPASFALKDFQILFTAIAGPFSYLAWRLLLRPGWALAIGVIAVLCVLEPYKPYGPLALALFVPLIIKFLQILRRADKHHWFVLLRLGVVFGAAFGVICLLYSGWFRWSAPGVAIAALVLFPWRSKAGRKHAVVFGASALLAFGLLCFNYVTEIRSVVSRNPSGMALIQDNYTYFDTDVDPAYVAMWRGDLPGNVTVWPPPGELGGVGLFTLAVFVGLGISIMFGYRRTVVIAAVLMLAVLWLQRMWTAHYMFTTKLVALYPRTSIEILYLLVIITGFAIYYIVESIARRIPASPLRTPPALIGALCTLMMLFGSMASSISDKIQPSPALPLTQGWLAWQAHMWKKDGTKPMTTPPTWPADRPAP